MSDNVVSFNRPKTEPTKVSEAKPPKQISEVSGLPGLSVAYVDIDDSNIDEVGDIVGKIIETTPGDLQLIFGGEKPVTKAGDFDDFNNFVMKLFDNVYNEVVMGHLLDMHDGLPENSRQVFCDDVASFLCRIKCKVASGVVPQAHLVVQLSLNTFGLLANLVYGTRDTAVYDHTPMISFVFKAKVD